MKQRRHTHTHIYIYMGPHRTIVLFCILLTYATDKISQKLLHTITESTFEFKWRSLLTHWAEEVLANIFVIDTGACKYFHQLEPFKCSGAQTFRLTAPHARVYRMVLYNLIVVNALLCLFLLLLHINVVLWYAFGQCEKAYNQ